MPLYPDAVAPCYRTFSTQQYHTDLESKRRDALFGLSAEHHLSAARNATEAKKLQTSSFVAAPRLSDKQMQALLCTDYSSLDLETQSVEDAELEAVRQADQEQHQQQQEARQQRGRRASVLVPDASKAQGFLSGIVDKRRIDDYAEEGEAADAGGCGSVGSGSGSCSESSLARGSPNGASVLSPNPVLASLAEGRRKSCSAATALPGGLRRLSLEQVSRASCSTPSYTSRSSLGGAPDPRPSSPSVRPASRLTLSRASLEVLVPGFGDEEGAAGAAGATGTAAAASRGGSSCGAGSPLGPRAASRAGPPSPLSPLSGSPSAFEQALAGIARRGSVRMDPAMLPGLARPQTSGSVASSSGEAGAGYAAWAAAAAAAASTSNTSASSSPPPNLPTPPSPPRCFTPLPSCPSTPATPAASAAGRRKSMHTREDDLAAFLASGGGAAGLAAALLLPPADGPLTEHLARSSSGSGAAGAAAAQAARRASRRSTVVVLPPSSTVAESVPSPCSPGLRQPEGPASAPGSPTYSSPSAAAAAAAAAFGAGPRPLTSLTRGSCSEPLSRLALAGCSMDSTLSPLWPQAGGSSNFLQLQRGSTAAGRSRGVAPGGKAAGGTAALPSADASATGVGTMHAGPGSGAAGRQLASSLGSRAAASSPALVRLAPAWGAR